MEKLRIGWGLRASKFEEKVGEMEETRWVKICDLEEETKRRLEGFVRSRERCYNRNGWRIIAVDNMVREERNLKDELRLRDRDVQW